MWKNLNSISEQIQFINKKRFIFYLYQTIIIFLIFTLSILCIFSLLNYTFLLHKIFNYIFFLLLILIFSILITRLIIISNTDIEIVISQIQSKFKNLKKDDIINAYQIDKNIQTIKKFGMSEEISQIFIKNVSDKISSIPINEIIDFKELKKILFVLFYVFILVVFLYFYKSDILKQLLNTIFFPDNITNYMYVYPGNIKIAYGSDINIKIVFKKNIEVDTFPQLFIKTDKEYRKIDVNLKENFFISNDINIIKPTEYFIKWKNLHTKKYLIEPVDVPKLGDFIIQCFFPSYTELEPKTIKNFNEISYLPLTVLSFKAKCNREISKVSMVTSWNKIFDIKVVNKTQIKGEFAVEQPGEIYFDIKTEDNIIDPAPPRYPIKLIQDNYPEIEIISPEEDLVVVEDAVLDIVYKIQDDFGISKINLICSSKNINKIIEIAQKQKLFNNSEIKEYKFNIATLKLKPTDEIEYFLEIFDNDIITGPKRSVSKTHKLYIFSFEEEHKKIEQDLKNFRDKLLSVLGQQISTKTFLEQQISTVTPQQINNLNKIIESQEDIKNLTKELSQKLSDILPKMESDPYTNYQVYTEHKSIQKGLEVLEKQQMSYVIDSLKNNDSNTALNLQNEIINNLEKMNLLAEDVLQYQKMNDLISSNEKISKLTEDLINSLETQKPDEKTVKELEKLTEEIEKTLSEINKLLKNLPQELPEEFVNKPAIKQVNLNKFSDITKNLRENISSGNFQDALKQAKELLSQAKELLKTLHESSDSVGFGSMESNITTELTENFNELNNLISEQKKLIKNTQELEKKRQEYINEKQQKLFDKLKEKQKIVINQTENLAKNTKPEINIELYKILSLMNSVYKEFEKKYIVKSKEYLKDIINQLNNIENNQNNFLLILSTTSSEYEKTKYIVNQTKQINNSEKEIFDILNNIDYKEFSEKNINELKNIQQQQDILKTRTLKLDKNIQELSRKTATITPEISYNLRKAGYEMEKANQEILAGKTNITLAHQEKALEYLTMSNNSMDNSLEQLSQIQKNSGKPMANFIQRPVNMSGGTTGVKTGYVKLPPKDDFIPTRELKEQLMKSLKEKYPQVYDTIIKQYYRSITE